MKTIEEKLKMFPPRTASETRPKSITVKLSKEDQEYCDKIIKERINNENN